MKYFFDFDNPPLVKKLLQFIIQAMIFTIEIKNKTYKIDTSDLHDLSIPLDFNGNQPNAFGVEKASAKACETGNLVGDTRQGGSCNFEQIKFIPHCNGTHTEGVGHLTNERISVIDCLQDTFVFAVLISVKPQKVSETNETYAVELGENDQLLTRSLLENTLSDYDLQTNIGALIIRTLPNSDDKLTKTYLAEIPPFFTTEAMKYLNETGVKHLLIDLPSIDRIYDDGKLSNHRIFWNVGQGKFELNEKSLINKTITEMIYVSDNINDGLYLLNLQIAPFVGDASPSRPVIFSLH